VLIDPDPTCRRCRSAKSEHPLKIGEIVVCKEAGLRRGDEVMDFVRLVRPKIIVLDIMLPGLSGLDFCRRLRNAGLNTPVIMLTARGQEIDKVLGLEIGADDYITKPFSVRELIARVRALLRRSSNKSAETDVCRFGDIELDFSRHQAQKRGKALELSPREFRMLKYFLLHRGETVTRDQLLDEVWGYDNFPLTRTVDNHIARLRQKIENNPSEPDHIITVHRMGYKFLG